MPMKNTTTAAALVGGYLLGRTKKAKMAIGVGMFLAGRRLDLDPRRLGKLLAASPVTGALSEQIRRELFEATKSAAAQALTQRATGLADSLQQRTRALSRDGVSEAGADDEAEDRTRDDEAADGQADRGGGADESRQKRTRSTAAAKTARKKSTSGTASRSGSSGRGSGTSTTPRKRTSAAKKSTASRTRKSRGDGDE